MEHEKNSTSTETSISELWDIIKRLRAPNGCPWDREQTPLSVKKYILEETYELIEAIESEDHNEVMEELGDVIFMLIFIGFMYEETGAFSFSDAVKSSAVKMKRRHPHIFGEVKVKGTSDVISNWQTIKAEESKKKGERHSVLGNLPKALPALQRAYRVGERASRVGFDWENADDVWNKVKEEEEELKQAIKSGDKESVAHEMGDLLFSLANMARLLELNPEDALHGTINRFIKRFHAMEQVFSDQGKDLGKASLEEMETVWSQIKNKDI